jgi:hypothetical protein
LASLFQRWRRGLPLSPRDFLYLREQARQARPGYLAPQPMLLLADLLGPHLVPLGTDFLRYYQLAPPRVTAAFQAGLAFAVSMASPEVLAATNHLDSPWTEHLVAVVRGWAWLYLQIGYLDTQALDDEAFRVLFEREWGRLQPFRGSCYDFRVIPRLSHDDFVRYQQLPRGNREIRRALSTYLAHQAKESPHLFKPWFPLAVDLAFGRRLRQMYAPLVEAVTREALQNLGATGTDRARLQTDLRAELWQVYDRSWTGFQFYWNYPSKERPFGDRGFVGFAESPRARELFDQLMAALGRPERSRDLSEIAFAHYINQRLRGWVARRYPPDPRPITTLSLEEPQGLDGLCMHEQSWNYVWPGLRRSRHSRHQSGEARQPLELWHPTKDSEPSQCWGTGRSLVRR